MSTIDDARRVAADMLRQAGDEAGARVLERAGEVRHGVEVALTAALLHHRPASPTQALFDLLAYLDPAWAEAEVERAHGEAVEMHEAWKKRAVEFPNARLVWLREYEPEERSVLGDTPP